MSTYSYIALDSRGHETAGTIHATDQDEALRRIKEMGCFPTNVSVAERMSRSRDKNKRRVGSDRAKAKPMGRLKKALSNPVMGGAVKPRMLAVTTRQLATLIEAGMPLLRGLRLLEEQERRSGLRDILHHVGVSIECGATFSEALAQHPKVFNRLYLNMVRAGEAGGVLEVVLKRLAEFMEKALKIKGRVIAALFYPVAVMVVAIGILTILMAVVVPKFQEVFASGLGNGTPMPPFTLFVLGISHAFKSHLLAIAIAITVLALGWRAFIQTRFGRQFWDRLKLELPIFGEVIRKASISRFTRTLGTLMSSGVPILQALNIVKETAGNVAIGAAIAAVHDSVKEGETIAAPLKATRIFPAVVVGMVDVGEQTGALPDMLLKIADTYDDEVDNAVSAMTSLLEPIMIIFLAVIVGSIVIALFLPIIDIINNGVDDRNGAELAAN